LTFKPVLLDASRYEEIPLPSCTPELCTPELLNSCPPALLRLIAISGTGHYTLNPESLWKSIFRLFRPTN
jgi:hypothetical protein